MTDANLELVHPDVPKVKQSDARILREALAHCATYASGPVRLRALSGLKNYAIRVAPYCKHADVSDYNGGTCLDCGANGVKKHGF